jgi:LmbE family N-acetylglucosaminyl deacetylase
VTVSGPGRTLAVCVAHPDDESYAIYGTVALHRHDPGLRLVVLHATDGEGGQVANGVALSPDGLGAQPAQTGAHVRIQLSSGAPRAR